MAPLEQCVYANLHTTIMEDTSIHTDQIVYLAPPTETAFERIHSRARPGEEGIQCSLIYKLAKLHEEYLGVHKDVYQMRDNEYTDIEVMLGELVPTRVRGVQRYSQFKMRRRGGTTRLRSRVSGRQASLTLAMTVLAWRS